MLDRQVTLFGLPVDALSLPEVLDRCSPALDSRTPLQIGVINAAKVVNLRKDARLREALLGCDLLVADGMSVVWASRLLRRPLPERVAGIDLFERLLELAARDGWSVYLLGATAQVQSELQRRISARWPDLKIAGGRDGYFAETEAAEVAAEIGRSGADMLFLGMTSPKKEIFLERHGHLVGAPVLHGVGGSFDVLAGVTKRAPLAWQRLGLEWAYRLLQEPGRLWRRYLVTNTVFTALVLRELVSPSPPMRSATTPSPRTEGTVTGGGTP